MNINEDIDRDLLEKHHFALFMVKTTMDIQSQPVVITDATVTQVKFSLRMNLNEQQLNRLIIDPIAKNLKGLYVVGVNASTRIMRLKRVNKAMKIDDNKKIK